MSEPAIAIGGTEVDLKGFGHGIVVPINPQSHLMYYLGCINTLLKAKEGETDRDMRKLCDYKHYFNLTEAEIDKLILLCFILSPDVLRNKCIFQCDDLCQDFDNNFFEFNAVSSRFIITRDLLIGGERRAVKRIMAYRMCWLEENWKKPMEHYKDRLRRITQPGSFAPPERSPQSAQNRRTSRSRGNETQASTAQQIPSSRESSQSGRSWCSVM